MAIVHLNGIEFAVHQDDNRKSTGYVKDYQQNPADFRDSRYVHVVNTYIGSFPICTCTLQSLYSRDSELASTNICSKLVNRKQHKVNANIGRLVEFN